MTSDELRSVLNRAEEEGRDDEDIGLIFVGTTSRGLPVRPRILSESQNGEKVYMITVRQLRKLVRFADDARAA